MKNNHKYRKDGIYHLDDGGSAKSSERRNRRRRKQACQIMKYPVGIGMFLIVLLQGSSIRDNIMTTERQKANNASYLHSILRNDENRNNRSFNTITNGQNPKLGNTFSENGKYRWTTESIIPPVGDQKSWAMQFFQGGKIRYRQSDFKVAYGTNKQEWEYAAEALGDDIRPPTVDYTQHSYLYPDIIAEPPRGGSYPAMETLGEILRKWPQNDLDTPPTPFVERLQHFDFNDPEQMEIAERYRDLEFPFKLTNVPELNAANEKWTDEYLSFHFDRSRKLLRDTFNQNYHSKELYEKYGHVQRSDGHCQESMDSFFAFFTAKNWNSHTMGEAPTKDTDFTFAKWAKHARYADSVGLEPTEPHYYWQSGASPQERQLPTEEWTMISLDLPSFSDPFPNFVSFNPAESKGIQCRFGERGVTAATHYDGGRNMVGMITGAKRYILAPPRECPKLGIVTEKKHPTFRHSLLNFDHINILNDENESKVSFSDLFVAKNCFFFCYSCFFFCSSLPTPFLPQLFIYKYINGYRPCHSQRENGWRWHEIQWLLTQF